MLCRKKTCDIGTGICACVAQNSGAPRDAHISVCTVADACAGTNYLPGRAMVCDDNNPCTTDTCDPTKGCGAKAAPDGTPCGEGGVCTAGTCSLGTSLNPAPSCLAILTTAPKSASGLYWLDLDGSGSDPALQTWCEMKWGGGGCVTGGKTRVELCDAWPLPDWCAVKWWGRCGAAHESCARDARSPSESG